MCYVLIKRSMWTDREIVHWKHHQVIADYKVASILKIRMGKWLRNLHLKLLKAFINAIFNYRYLRMT